MSVTWSLNMFVQWRHDMGRWRQRIWSTAWQRTYCWRHWVTCHWHT